MDRADFGVRSRGNPINRNACVNNRVIVSSNDFVIDDRCIVDFRHLPMWQAEATRGVVMEMIERHKYEEIRAQSEVEVEANRLSKEREAEPGPITRCGW